VTRHLLSIVLLAFLTCIARADEISLTPTESPSAPYGVARLSIPSDQIPSATRAIRVRDALGGPTWIVPIIPATDGPTTYLLPLPPLRVYQDYTIDMLPELDARATSLNSTQVSVAWPASHVNRDAFINPDFCTDFDARQPQWPSAIRWGILFASVLIALLCVAIRLIPWARTRPAILLVIPLLAAGLAILFLRTQPAIVERHTTDGDITILTAQRSATWTHENSFRPVFRDLGGWMEDQTIILPDRIQVPVTPGQVKLLVASPDALAN